MKKQLQFFMTVLTLIVLNSLVSSCDSTPSTTCSDTILTAPYNTGLVAYYKFSNGSLNDFSGNGHNGTIVGTVTPTTNKDGNANCAMGFPGSQTVAPYYSYIKVPASPAFDFDSTQQFSIVLWYKYGTINFRANDSIGILFSNGDENYCGAIGSYSLQSSFGHPEFSLNNLRVIPDYTSYPQYYNNSFINIWKNMIVTFDGSNSNVNQKRKIYIDGVLVTSLSNPFSELLNCGPDVTPTGDILIGKFFNGSIDDIKVYNRLLNASEISFLSTYVSPCCQ